LDVLWLNNIIRVDFVSDILINNMSDETLKAIINKACPYLKESSHKVRAYLKLVNGSF
jgi:hypothetical protein